MADIEARITARIIVLPDAMTVREEAGDIVENVPRMMIAEEVIPHVIVQGAVLVLLNIVGAVVLVLLAMLGTEITVHLVSTVLVAPEVEGMRMMSPVEGIVDMDVTIKL